MPIGKNITFLTDGFSLADALTSISPEATANLLDATVLAHDYRSYESGFKEGRLSCSGFFNFDNVTLDKIHSVFGDAFLDGLARTITASFGTVSAGADAWMMDGCSVKYDITTPLGELITVASDFRSNNGINFGKWLVSAQRNAGSFNSTNVDNLVVSTNGGLFHAHLANDTATGVVVKLQRSTDNMAWIDLAEAIFGVRASGTYTFGVNPSNLDTILFNGVTFTFITGASTATDIQIKGTLALTLAEAAIVLNASVNGSVSIATYTNTSTVIRTTVDAPGAAGSSYTQGTNTGNIVRSAATLTGGADITDDHDAYSETIAVGVSISRHLRTQTIVSGGNTELVSAAFARR